VQAGSATATVFRRPVRPDQVRALNDDVRQRWWLLAYVVASLPSGLGVRVHVGEAEEVDDGVHLRAVGERHALAGIPALREESVGV
jgi:hypothetical protein